MKSNLNLWKITVTLFAMVVFAFGCSNSGNQQPADESATDTTAISPSTGTSAAPSDTVTMPTETRDAQTAADKTSQTPTAESSKLVKDGSPITGKNSTQPKVAGKSTKPVTATSSTGKTSKPVEVKPQAPPTAQPKPEPKITPVETPAGKPEPPVQTAPKTAEKPAPPAKPEVPKPAPSTSTGAKDWPVPEKDKNTANPIRADKESLSNGKSLYLKHCASCHGKRGLGDGTKAASLKTACGDFTEASFQAQTDGALFYKITKGRDDMPSFKKKLPDTEEIWSIVNYIRTLK